MTAVRQGLVALGDSITRGRGGSPTLGVHPQSWALWLAEALDLPYSNLGIDGEVAVGLVVRQLPRLRGPYDLATLYIGANDTRGFAFDAVEYEDAVRTALAALQERAERILLLTIPLDLGRPRAGEDVVTANAVLRRLAPEFAAILCELDDFGGRRHVLPDAVHPTSEGMVEMAERAAAALAAAGFPVPRRPRELLELDPSPADLARFELWWARQAVRDRRKQLAERYLQRPR